MTTETFQMTVRRRVGKEYPARYEDVLVSATVEVDMREVARQLAKKALHNSKGVSKRAIGVKVTVRPV